MLRTLTHSCIIILLFVSIFYISYKFDQVRPDRELQKFLYLAKNNQVKSFAFGFEAEYADILWMLSIQAFHRDRFDKIPFTEADQVYKSIRLLDPHFIGMYETALFFICLIEGKSSPGINFIKEATKQKMSLGAKYPEKEHLANQPWIWHLLATAYRLERHNMEKKEGIPVEDSMREAVFCLNKALDLSHNLWKRPFPEAELLLKFIISKDKGFVFDILTWLEIYERSVENESLRSVMKEKIKDSIVDIHLNYLNEQIQKYQKESTVPITSISQISNYSLREPDFEDMDNIIKRIINIVVEESSKKNSDILSSINKNLEKYIIEKLGIEFGRGKDYGLDIKKNIAISISGEKEKLEKMINLIQYKVKRFQEAKGFFPKSLEELVAEKYITELYELPLGKEYEYNPDSGIIGYTPADEK